MDTKYRSKGHCKFLLRYHLILVCKYRLKLMSASNISSDIKKMSEQIAKKHNVDIRNLESDEDHIHQRRRAGSLDFCKLWEECPIQRRILISSIELRQNI